MLTHITEQVKTMATKLVAFRLSGEQLEKAQQLYGDNINKIAQELLMSHLDAVNSDTDTVNSDTDTVNNEITVNTVNITQETITSRELDQLVKKVIELSEQKIKARVKKILDNLDEAVLIKVQEIMESQEYKNIDNSVNTDTDTDNTVNTDTDTVNTENSDTDTDNTDTLTPRQKVCQILGVNSKKVSIAKVKAAFKRKYNKVIDSDKNMYEKMLKYIDSINK